MPLEDTPRSAASAATGELQRVTRRYYGEGVENWLKFVYADPREAGHFPFGAARLSIVDTALRDHETARGFALDVGCGGGQISALLARAGFEVLALDSSPAMLDSARATLTSLGLQQVTFQEGDVLQVDLPARRADFIVAMGLIEYLESPEIFLERCGNQLRAGGLLLVEFRNRLLNALSGNRFTILEAERGELARIAAELDDLRGQRDVHARHVVEYAEALCHTELGNLRSDDEAGAAIPPFPGERRQHTPAQLRELAAPHGLELIDLYGMHPHPFLPVFESRCPRHFNALAWSLQQIPRNPFVLETCSSMAALFRKAS